MPIFRMSAVALLNFDVRANTPEEAMAKADAVVARLEDGVDVENVDTEEELVDACVYPTREPAAILDEREEEEVSCSRA